MKIACSSASFARALEEGTLTQLEWLDISANELEVDGVVFDAAHFPRRDVEYLAQLVKACVDLGLSVAGLSVDALFESDAAPWLETALALRAPLVVARAPKTGDDASAWGGFADAAKAASRLAKKANVTLALRNAAGTLCESAADLKRLAKDVDSAWLRFAPDLVALGSADDAAALLPKSVIALHAMSDPATFARDDDAEAGRAIRALQRFRGFLVLDRAASHVTGAATQHGDDPNRAPYHDALLRFYGVRARALAPA
jgi:hypothetical protein